MAPSLIQTYAPGEVIVSFRGQILTGFGDDIFAAKRTTKLYSQVVGADGEVAHVKSADKTGEVKVTAKQTSAINAILGAIVQADELAGAQIGELLLADNNGHTLWSSQARLDGWPEEVSRGKDAKDQVWTFIVSHLEFEFAVLPSVA